jgi:pre-mRNA-splicing factor ATP-dependent RNA helicase DHX15/PRP43
MSGAKDNPYLGHLPAHERGVGPVRGSSSAAIGAKEPLFGFLPRNVTAEQVTKAMVRTPVFLISFAEFLQG